MVANASSRLLPLLSSNPCLWRSEMATWDELVDATLATLAGKNLLFMQRLITLEPPPPPSRTFAGPGPWDRPTVEIRLDGASTQEWLALSQCPAPLHHACPCSLPTAETSILHLFCFVWLIRWLGQRGRRRGGPGGGSLLRERLHRPRHASDSP